ncbi:MAG: M1 family metallopeptidase [Deltaproteobacteria bacterium]|nr:M1 family metallopeptidase [Deltaproteobacteria bacterium]
MLLIPRRMMVLAWATAFWSIALSALEPPLPQRSPRNANYTIDVSLDTETRILSGRQILSWRNIQQQATDELWFHLYWNGWRNNRSTWLLEDRIRGRSTAGKNLSEEDWSYLTISSVKVRGLLPVVDESVAGVADQPGAPPLSEDSPQQLAPAPKPTIDLSTELKFMAPDDGNSEDRTVAMLQLPFQVEPGQSLEVEMEWTARVPRTFARTGTKGSFYFIAHWFPKLGVFEGDSWNCHQFHSATEFYSDYGNYDVRITVPAPFVVGATGRLVEKTLGSDGSATHRYTQNDVHGFAWTASPDYREHTGRFDEPGYPPVELRLLLQPEHEDQAERHFEATRTALKYYGSWYGPYPYQQLTIVDPAYGSGAGGMEYPTLFTSGTRWLNPAGGGSPEGVTIHEAGHQFWYGVVGNNEFEHAWLDEGLNTFSTARAYEAAYGDRKFVQRYLSLPGRGRGFLPWLFPELAQGRTVFGNRLDRYRRSGVRNRQSRPTYLYYPASASSTSYHRTSLWLATLERFIGWDSLQEILSTFYQRWSFRHPRPENFFSIANEVSGRDLDWFFDQVHGSSVDFDYAIGRVSTTPLKFEGYSGAETDLRYEGREEESSQDAPEKIFRSEVVVERRADGVFPVEVLMIFEDGSEVRRSWDGRNRWQLLVEERASKLTQVKVDPERILVLDLDVTNNSHQVDSGAALPSHKWASRWMFWLQDFLHTVTFFL